MVTIESMAQGTPVIGSNAGGTPELLHFGKLGLLYETKNEFDLAEKMKMALEKAVNFDKILLQNAVQLFNQQAICRKVEELIRNNHPNLKTRNS